ncbi:MAG TPA: hypothetical protein VLB11_07495 [Methyloceanibacter sp.]|nr:hypothetical protein [Methyloceanibacter sp.]
MKFFGGDPVWLQAGASAPNRQAARRDGLALFIVCPRLLSRYYDKSAVARKYAYGEASGRTAERSNIAWIGAAQAWMIRQTYQQIVSPPWRGTRNQSER